MRSKTPWRLKLRPEQQPKIVPDRRGRMLVPTPMLVAAELKRVRRGRLITAAQLRDRLALQAVHLRAEGHRGRVGRVRDAQSALVR